MPKKNFEDLVAKYHIPTNNYWRNATKLQYKLKLKRDDGIGLVTPCESHQEQFVDKLWNGTRTVIGDDEESQNIHCDELLKNI